MKKEIIKDFIRNVLIALALVIVLINFVIMPCVVEGTSMNNTLFANDFGYSFIISRKLGIKRFDIAVIKVGDKNDSKLIVKRVIGLPNETIEYRDNKLYIDGELYEEEYLGNVSTDDLKITLSDNEYYCLGDNRPVSRDSRFYGPFNSEQIVSTHLLILYPLKDFGFKK